uniref:Uncharacterized protein n=1 Tax=Glossina brevipalpis TaxID=37001 RepID=A0A1A9X4W9_9MUSC
MVITYDGTQGLRIPLLQNNKVLGKKYDINSNVHPFVYALIVCICVKLCVRLSRRGAFLYPEKTLSTQALIQDHGDYIVHNINNICEYMSGPTYFVSRLHDILDEFIVRAEYLSSFIKVLTNKKSSHGNQ